ncbi:MAG: tetratricopeptide repeat protein [Cyanobacteria bacterium P01_A01_bin.116]
MLFNLAELHQKCEQWQPALAYCERALELAEEIGMALVEECRQM